MTARIRIGDRVRHCNGGIGVVSGYVYHEDAKTLNRGKRDTKAIEVAWVITGVATSEWRDDLERA